jgi:uncharacterized membrane protein (UPF0136 family)
MSSSTSSGPYLSIPLIEGGLTLILVALSFAAPRLGSPLFSRIEGVFVRLAEKKWLALAVVGLSVLLLRLAILPILPIPLPFIPDDFSFLLAADTFAHGRLTNPTPEMWVHFESIHIDMQPTYMSMYFPSLGLVLAAARLLFGHPWYGMLIASAFMCSAICWMLQAWLPPRWALLGGMLAVVRLGIFSYWTNTYHAAGSLAAVGGALILGAMPRFMRTHRARYALLMAVGVILLVYTRPYEGMLLCLPVVAALVHWIITAKNRPAARELVRLAAVPLGLLIAAGAWLGYYDYKAFGSPLTLPYTVNRATYAMAPYYVWQSPRPEPHYHHEELRRFYHHNELDAFQMMNSPLGFIHQTFNKVVKTILFFGGLALIPPLFMVRRVFLDRRLRFLIVCLLVLMAGMVIEIFMIPHYLAPFTVVLYAIGVQATRHLWHWRPGDQPVGMTIVRMTVALCIVMASLRLFDKPLNFPIDQAPASKWNSEWYGPDRYGTARAEVERKLNAVPGEQLVLVRYTPDHDPIDEWVYNAADIDHSKVIWARDMDTIHNRELFEYYRDRKIWLVQPDSPPESVLSPYPVTNDATLASR